MKNLILFAVTFSMIGGISSTARADHDSPLYAAADAYRDAVKAFEDRAKDHDHLPRYDRRLVDQLEDATSDLRSAAKHPEELERLLFHWNNVQPLHSRVDLAIFHRPGYPVSPLLSRSWQRVDITFNQLAAEMSLLHTPHVHAYRSHRPVISGPPALAPRGGDWPRRAPYGSLDRRDSPDRRDSLDFRDRRDFERPAYASPLAPMPHAPIHSDRGEIHQRLPAPVHDDHLVPAAPRRQVFPIERRGEDVGRAVIRGLLSRLLD